MEFHEDQLFRVVSLEVVRRRKEKGMSQRTLATRAGVAQGFICDIEKGRANPTWHCMDAVCRALDSTLPQLILDAAFRDVKLTSNERKMVQKLSKMLIRFSTSEEPTPVSAGSI